MYVSQNTHHLRQLLSTSTAHIRTAISLNTGFIKEDAKETIEELFLSENVFIRFENKTLPIHPVSKSFIHKTSLNDKLINYSVDFEFAFDKINNVR